ncbi:hypothetical protein [Streptomyces sp. CB01881]|uniref:hypothetical protein n=1 Tax=Streptomyces sp. CB01881 TaxID=2078691 RepID=UPI00129C879B|nr:hypothetical protein [Streptomyces sp. CB01881]
MQGQWDGELVGPDVWETCRELIPVGSVFAFLAEHMVFHRPDDPRAPRPGAAARG